MRLAFAVTLMVLAGAGPAAAGGGLDAGGGVRTDGLILVRDALGMPLAGVSGADSVTVTSGLLFGVSFPTPVLLAALELSVTADGVTLTWRAGSDSGVLLYLLERAPEASDGSVGGYTEIAAPFEGPGPHTWLDRDAVPGNRYRYRLRARLRDGSEEVLGPWPASVPASAVPAQARILAASPNPFRDAFVISFALPRDLPVRWRLLDVRGALVSEGDLGIESAGIHATAVRPPEAAARGVYFLQVEAGGLRTVQKVVKLP